MKRELQEQPTKPKRRVDRDQMERELQMEREFQIEEEQMERELQRMEEQMEREQMQKRDSASTTGTTTASTAASATSDSAGMPLLTSAAASTASSASSSSDSSSSESSSSDSSGSMPGATTTSSSMPGVSSTSAASTSSTSYTFVATVPTGTSYEANPYISKLTLPTNTVFIGLGSVGGFVIVAFVLSLLAIWIVSRAQAKRDKEVYVHTFSLGASSIGLALHLLGSSQLSLLEKLSSSLRLQGTNTSLALDTTAQGRTYQEMLKTLERRNSMSISPVFALMMHGLKLNLELPMFHSGLDLPVSAMDSMYKNDSMRELERLAPLGRQRPPLQVLDDMLLGIEFASRYPDANNHEI